MTSQNRIDANRRNALRSTGPRSTSGKFRSRYNALWHGAFAADLLLPGEDPRAFASLRRKLRNFYRPANEEEELIVNRILLCAWRLQRLAATESRILLAEARSVARDSQFIRSTIATVLQGDDCGSDDSGSRDPIAVAWIRDANSGNTLAKLSRQQHALERSLYRSIDQLERRRARRDIAPAT
jgi:hypothetical protein